MKQLWGLLIGAGLVLAGGAAAGESSEFLVPAIGESRLVYDSNPNYINDHTVVRAEDGTWHLIGITAKKRLGGRLPIPAWEDEFAHAAAPELAGPWTGQPNVLRTDWRLGETHVWAPHIVFSNGLYYCFYAGGGGHFASMINLATSPDLAAWTRRDHALFRGFYDARDPMVLRDGDRWIMYYTKTYSTADWRSAVAWRTSADLINWSEPGFALALTNRPGRLINSGQTESPFVVKIGGLYYLFFCSPDQTYRTTYVYVSDDPLHFEEADEVTILSAHCAEVIEDNGQWWLSHAGWFYDGMYLAPLGWEPARKFSPGFRLADSGESDQYLAAAPKAKTVSVGLYLGLRAGPGEGMEYRFPVPAGVSWITVAFEEFGETLVSVAGRIVRDEGAAGLGEPTLQTVELRDPALWSDGSLGVRFEDSDAEGREGPVISSVKVYYR